MKDCWEHLITQYQGKGGYHVAYLMQSVRVGDPTSAQAGGYRSLPRCIAPLLPDPGKCWQRLSCTGRMIPKPRDLAKGQVDIPMT